MTELDLIFFNEASTGRMKIIVTLQLSMMISAVQDYFSLLETVFFTFKLLEKEKYKIKNLAVKKGFLSFYSVCMFVYMCVYMCVCVFVCLFALYRRHRLTQEAEILTQIPICEYLKMVSFTFLKFCLFFELFPFFQFLQFSLF